MSIEHSQNMACCLRHFIIFFFWKVRSWSVRTGPENFDGPVRKDLNLLGPLVHYFARQLMIWIWLSRNLVWQGPVGLPPTVLKCSLLSKCSKKILLYCCKKNHVGLCSFKKSLAPLCKRSLQIITPPQRGDWYSLRRLFIHSIQNCNNNGTTGLIS